MLLQAKSLVAAGAAKPLVAQLREGDALAQEAAAAALQQLTCEEGGGDNGQIAVMVAGGVPTLVQRLTDGSEAIQAHAMAALHDIAQGAVRNRPLPKMAVPFPALFCRCSTLPQRWQRPLPLFSAGNEEGS